MTALGDYEDGAEVEAEDLQDVESRRTPSAIQFPYGDLNDGVEVARAMYASAGSSGATWDQLAGWLGYGSPASGAFRNKISTARIFGLTETISGGAVLTALGHHIVDPGRERAARIRAFLNVPLYRVIYENHRGITLPPDQGLEQEMMALGVSPKQKERARQIFQRSADQAGFFAYGRNKLVMPVVEVQASHADGVSSADYVLRNREEEQNREVAAALPGGLHPLLVGLFHSLPKAGEPWPREKRRQWLTTAEHVFALVYPEES